MSRKETSATPRGLAERHVFPPSVVLISVPLSPPTHALEPFPVALHRLAVVPLVTGTQDCAAAGKPNTRNSFHTTIIVDNTRVMDSPPVAKVVPVSTTLFG